MTDVDLSRRAWLHGRSPRSWRDATVLPPWARARDFADRCTRCGDCIAACPEKILRVGDGGFPTVEFTHGGCTFCAACVDACRHDALSRQVDPPWRQVAHIGATCLVHQDVYCQSCRDACEARALVFVPRAGAPLPMPRIDEAACTGCGACVAVCPTQALRVLAPAS